jgi:hypothetical protein
MDSAALLYALYIFRRERLTLLLSALRAQATLGTGARIRIEENPMTSMEGASITRPGTSSPQNLSRMSARAQFLGKVFRTFFLIGLIVVTLRVALPQSETLWTIYDEPGDVVRFGLGVGVCVWLAVHLFKLPKESQAFQTWFHFGLAGVPFVIICAVFLWWNHLHMWWHALYG